MKVLITGGVGYIGSVLCLDLFRHTTHELIVLDDLSACSQNLPPGLQLQQWKSNVLDKGNNSNGTNTSRVHSFHQGCCTDKDILRRIFSSCKKGKEGVEEEGIKAVVHLAAYAIVPDSLADPLKYYRNNLDGVVHLLEVMHEFNCKCIVFASSCTAGSPDIFTTSPEDRHHPYGQSKRWGEEIIYQSCIAYGMHGITLRFFNASGASTTDPLVGEIHDPETHLIPNILKKLVDGKSTANNDSRVFQIYGVDYPTRDGTCIRDYLHVEDIARAIRLSLSKILINSESNNNSIYKWFYDCIDLGTGNGSTIREVLHACEKVTGKSISVKEMGRRPGDVAELVCDPSKAEKLLGWRVEKTLHDIISSAWDFHSRCSIETLKKGS